MHTVQLCTKFFTYENLKGYFYIFSHGLLIAVSFTLKLKASFRLYSYVISRCFSKVIIGEGTAFLRSDEATWCYFMKLILWIQLKVVWFDWLISHTCVCRNVKVTCFGCSQCGVSDIASVGLTCLWIIPSWLNVPIITVKASWNYPWKQDILIFKSFHAKYFCMELAVQKYFTYENYNIPVVQSIPYLEFSFVHMYMH